VTQDETPTDRVIEQRVRNRIMEELLYLVDGDQAVRDMGYGEYLEAFFTWFPTEGPPRENSALNAHEVAALLGVLVLMQKMYSEVPVGVGDEPLIATGWPQKIAPVAKQALDLFRARGRFDEAREELEPSAPG
jgi:hypothetical protein